MGSNGRYGKYGETKRFARLRKTGLGQPHLPRRGFEKSGRFAQHKNTPFYKEPIRIRLARVTDADFIRGLSKKVFNQYGPYDDTLTRWFLSGIAITVSASMGRRPVGFAMLGHSAYGVPFSRVYELLAIAVEPEMQNQGIGSLLVKEIEKKARELKVKTLVLHTAADNMAGRSLFTKHGFLILQRKQCFYPEGQDALMMYKDLFKKCPCN